MRPSAHCAGPGTNRAVARTHCVQGGFTPGVASTVVQPRAGHAASSTQSAPSATRARHPVITAMPVAVRGGARLRADVHDKKFPAERGGGEADECACAVAVVRGSVKRRLAELAPNRHSGACVAASGGGGAAGWWREWWHGACVGFEPVALGARRVRTVLGGVEGAGSGPGRCCLARPRRTACAGTRAPTRACRGGMHG